MTKVVLIRHGRSVANADGVLAGRMPGVALDALGREQAAAMRPVLAAPALVAAYTSPVERCRETARLAGWGGARSLQALAECEYGEWTGLPLTELARDPRWERVQRAPGGVRFPGGESMLEMRDRIVGAVAEIVGRHLPGEAVAVFSHGDPIKAVLAEALGLDFDRFQRIDVAPGSISVVDYADAARPVVQVVNGGADLAVILGSAHRPAVGGGDVTHG